MGMPRGLARRRNDPAAARTPAVAACAAPFLRNARLEIADMCASVFFVKPHNVLIISNMQIPRFARDDSGSTFQQTAKVPSERAVPAECSYQLLSSSPLSSLRGSTLYVVPTAWRCCPAAES